MLHVSCELTIYPCAAVKLSNAYRSAATKRLGTTGVNDTLSHSAIIKQTIVRGTQLCDCNHKNMGMRRIDAEKPLSM